MNPEAIRLERVSKTYLRGAEQVRALQDINLNVRQGEFLAITGPSGSGKSTLLHIMGCMDAPTCGNVYIRGKRIDSHDDKALSRLRQSHIGLVFQQFFLLPTLSALENAQLPTLFSGRRADALELLARVGLAERAQHFPHQLSGGEMQRVAIARALVNRPDILLADEPTGSLDSRSACEILSLLRELSQERTLTVVMITHNTNLAAQADRIVRLEDGKILNTESCFHEPRVSRQAVPAPTVS